MNIYIDRYDFTLEETFGKFRIPTENFEVDSLEDVARARGVKIPKHTCIPAGIYELKLTHSNRFKKILPLLYNVKADLSVSDGAGVTFTGVRIHTGNTDADTEGCILIGERLGNDIKGGTSKPAMKLLMEILERKKGEQISVIITNKQKQL